MIEIEKPFSPVDQARVYRWYILRLFGVKAVSELPTARLQERVIRSMAVILMKDDHVSLSDFTQAEKEFLQLITRKELF